MPKSRFVNLNAVVRVDLSDGDWIEFREKLSHGQVRALTAAITTRNTDQDGRDRYIVDGLRFGDERLKAYLVNWSFTDPGTGDPVPVTPQTIDALDPDTADELATALLRHLEKKASPPPATNADAT